MKNKTQEECKRLKLVRVKRTHPFLLQFMYRHYSAPKGFVGRNQCYAVVYDKLCYGFIVSGSTPMWLVGRERVFGYEVNLNEIVNNIFFRIEIKTRYPSRNFMVKVLKLWRETSIIDWEEQYGDKVMGWESLVELPRTGEVYIRDKWTLVGTTKGYSCKRVGGIGTDSYSGVRVWETKILRPKLVFCKKNEKGMQEIKI